MRIWEFKCNLCGNNCTFHAEDPADPETPSCSTCGSNVRFRWLVHRLSRELFGSSLPLHDFPTAREIKGLGLTDPASIAGVLAQRFTYLNTFLQEEPRLDIRRDPSPLGELDFLIASEVFEHVEPPVATAFANSAALLKPSGVFLLTVPWVWDGSEPLPELYDWKIDRENGEWVVVNRQRDGRVERFGDLSFDDGPGRSLGDTREHFPQLHEWSIFEDNGVRTLHNRRRDGSAEVFHNLAFHGGRDLTLEMRLFTKCGLERMLREAGFSDIQFEFENFERFGIIFDYPWGRPVVARRRSE